MSLPTRFWASQNPVLAMVFDKESGDLFLLISPNSVPERLYILGPPLPEADPVASRDDNHGIHLAKPVLKGTRVEFLYS